MTTSSSGDSGFLSRWSRRKLQGGADAAPAEPPTAPAPADTGLESPVSAHPPPIPAPAAEQPPAPTLEELAPLDHTADLTRFIASGVEEAVRRAALRKLFADPRFNVMDGLDTYIDDYNIPSPVPPGLLARLKLTPNLGLALPETAVANLGSEQAVAGCAMPTRTVPAPAGHAAAPSEQDVQADASVLPFSHHIPPST